MSTLTATEVTLENLMGQTAQLRQQGYRLVTMTCVHTGNGHEILYHFDKKYQMEHFRLHLPEGVTLPSICSLYPAAMIVENEIKDHFGIAVSGLSIDFQGRLVLTEDAPRAPMNKRCGMDIDARIPAAAPTAAPAVKGGAA
jgi:ech hydrogenase subunit D